MQKKPEWEQIAEFDDLAKKVADHYQAELSHITPDILDLLIAYKCTNKTKPAKKTKMYDMSGQGEPQAFTN